MHKFFVFFQFFAYRILMRDTDELRKRLVATWAEFRQNVVDDAVDQWRKRLEACIRAEVVTLNICCNVACLTFHLPHITTGSFKSHQRLKECNIPSVRPRPSGGQLVITRQALLGPFRVQNLKTLSLAIPNKFEGCTILKWIT